ncbi:glycyl-radical enzyme activating protein [Desulfosporosinus burensis]
MVNNQGKRVGNVFNIQKFSVHDGPGIRDLIFLKGCPLKCKWCSNPESQNLGSEIAYIQKRCLGIEQCGYCVRVCPTDAIQADSETAFAKIDRLKCNNCGKCVDVCPPKAITFFGKPMTVDEVIKTVQQDHVSWRSGGGITISGGELLLQADFVHDLLKECKRYGIDTAIETCGYANWTDVEKACEYANLIYYDIKSLDTEKHKAFTGVHNDLILKNLLKISERFPATPLIVRTPLIPGFNDSDEDIKAIIEFIGRINNLTNYEIIPYHAFGEAKYLQLGRDYTLSHLEVPDKEHVEHLNKLARTLLNVSGE